MHKHYFQVALPVPLRQTFTYGYHKKIQIGSRVEITFNNRNLTGYIHREVSRTNLQKVKPILKVLDKESLIDKKSLSLLNWVSDYYKGPIGEVFKSFFPPALRKGKEIDGAIKTYKITDLGLLTNVKTISRSKRQSEALLIFQELKELTFLKIKAEGISKQVLKALEEKKFIKKSSLKKIKCKDKVSIKDKFFLQLNNDQLKVFRNIKKNLNKNSFSLLFGITGSGKTEVYMHALKEIISKGKQALVLVPEIGLTPVLITELNKRFGVETVAVMHSAMTEKERLQSWVDINNGKKSILVGTRSAVFTPFKNLGLIVIDEEHDSSYKQFDSFKYSARDVGIYKSNLKKIPIILCSATPSLETLKNSLEGKYDLFKLDKRVKGAKEPEFIIRDLRSLTTKAGLSETTMSDIKKEIKKGNQVLIFLNRKGYSPVVYCKDCGWMPECKNCDVRMVFHINPDRFVCHHCGYKEVINSCQKCETGDLDFFQTGTEKIEKVLSNEFKEVKVLRFDREALTEREIRESFLPESGEEMIIIGTQILAKGHHLPNITLVVVVDSDGGLFSIDFRASERLAQQITQVSGRAGRSKKKGKVILQSLVPEHPFLEKLANSDYQDISRQILEERKLLNLPPFSYLINLQAESLNRDFPEKALNKIKLNFASEGLEIIGPKPAVIEKRKNYYRWELSLKSSNRKSLHMFVDKALKFIDNDIHKKVRFSVDVDPLT